MWFNRGVAQLAEHRFPKPGAAGSIPASPANFEASDAVVDLGKWRLGAKTI